MEDVSFYRQFDPENIDHYDTDTFTNKTRDPRLAVYEDNEMFFGTEDTQPELFIPENREDVEFEKSDSFEKSVKKFKNNFFEGYTSKF